MLRKYSTHNQKTNPQVIHTQKKVPDFLGSMHPTATENPLSPAIPPPTPHNPPSPSSENMSQILQHNTPLRYMTPQRWNRSRELHPVHVESDHSSTGERHGTPAMAELG